MESENSFRLSKQEVLPLVVESFDLQNMSLGLREELRAFVKEEGEAVALFTVGKEPKDRKVMEGLQAVANHAIYILGSLKEKNLEGAITIVRGGADSKIIGVGVIQLYMSRRDPDRARLYFGRAWNAVGAGVANAILKEQLVYLKSRGIKTYKARVSDASRTVYQRVGVSYEEDPENSNELLVSLV